MYFNKGKLPWQGLKAKSRQEKYDKICAKKSTTTVKSMCEGFPQEFAAYLNYCRFLAFENKPDYSHCRKLFRTLFLKQGYTLDYVFDWDLLDKKDGNKDDDTNEKGDKKLNMANDYFEKKKQLE